VLTSPRDCKGLGNSYKYQGNENVDKLKSKLKYSPNEVTFTLNVFNMILNKIGKEHV